MHRPKQSRHRNGSRPFSHGLCQDLQRKSAENEFFRGGCEKEKAECGEDGQGRKLAAGPLDTNAAEDQASAEERRHHSRRDGEASGKMSGPFCEKTDSESV